MKFIFPLLIFTVLLNSCKKKDSDPSLNQEPHALGHPITCPAIESIKDTYILLCKFQPGSFWVFKDSVTNKVDTLIVKSISTCSLCSAIDMSSGPCYIETFNISCSFKHDTDYVLKSIGLYIQEKGVVFDSKYFWTSGGQAMPLLYSTPRFYGVPSYKISDSLFITDRYYAKVASTYAIQFTNPEGTRMYPHSLTCYFNQEFGFLQIDFRNRITQELTGRRKIISRQIVR